MRVLISAPTRRRLRQRARWWKDNREYTEIFDDELRAALEKLAHHARFFRVDMVLDGHEIRHIVMKKSTTALYYYINDAKEIVRVVGVHGTATGGLPELDF